jgi:hypothetical protein
MRGSGTTSAAAAASTPAPVPAAVHGAIAEIQRQRLLRNNTPDGNQCECVLS